MKSFNRRDVLKYAFVATAAVGVGGGLALNRRAEAGERTTVAETYEYKGRRVTLHRVATSRRGAESLMSAVFIDDRPLHVMRYPDGRFASVMNHFETFPDLRATANAAVDALRGANLAPMRHN